MTPEQRLDRLERVAKLFVAAGLRAREQSRDQHENINILINMHMQNGEQWRAESHALNEKINILIDAQLDTNEQIRGLVSGQARADKETAELRKSHKLTDQALRAFINSLRKGHNGKS